MGGTSYNISSRSIRSETLGYKTKSVNEIFTQNRERKAHESMKSQGISLREARDSDVHPKTVPIIIALDLTGSMGHIPHELIKDGLPKLVGGIIQNGISSPAILFLGVGDHEVDSEPLQIGQFESGDEELDMWLTRTYIESGGGGNEGESYSLAHYFAARCCVTDAWEKRNQKGFLFTIGDEPNLKSYPSSAMREITGNGDIKTFSDVEILQEAQQKWNVYHIFPGRERSSATSYWKQLLGDNVVSLSSHEEVADTIKKIVCEVQGGGIKSQEFNSVSNQNKDNGTKEKEEIIL